MATASSSSPSSAARSCRSAAASPAMNSPESATPSWPPCASPPIRDGSPSTQRPRTLDRRLRPALTRRRRPARRRDPPRRSARRPPRRHLRHPGLRREHPAPPPRSGARRLALRPQSARWIFGDSIGDPTADEIWALAKTRPAGVTRTDVRDLFSRNKKAREIERALTVLEEAGRLQRTTVTDGRGRPAETWLPATPARAA